MNSIDILSFHNLKRTSCREGIIDIMIKEEIALSECEIKARLIGNYDRTTFYRSFKTLEDYNIIHKIVVDNQLVKYALVKTDKHKANHAHFFCNSCNSVKCLETVAVQQAVLPEGYFEQKAELIIKGICPACKVNPEEIG